MEFTYNKYQATIGMTSYEALYGKKCQTLIYWEEMSDRKLIGPNILYITSEKVRIIRDRMKATQDGKKSYANVRRRPLEFNVGDRVFLKL
jgi:hypothetical protein